MSKTKIWYSIVAPGLLKEIHELEDQHHYLVNNVLSHKEYIERLSKRIRELENEVAKLRKS